jgi:hypothetical protein
MLLKSIIGDGLPPFTENRSLSVLGYSETHDFGGSQFLVLRVVDFYYHDDEDPDAPLGTGDAQLITHWCSLERPGHSVESNLKDASVCLLPALSFMLESGDMPDNKEASSALKRGYDIMMKARWQEIKRDCPEEELH